MTESTDSENSATIAILLVATEITNGRTNHWHFHSGGGTGILNAGKLILDSSLNAYHHFLTRSLIYFDVLSAVTLGTMPSLDKHIYIQ